MNEADSKRLEEIKRYRQVVGYTMDDEFNWLISKLREQDLEIAKLRERLPGTDAPWTLKELDDAKECIKGLEEEIAELNKHEQMLADSNAEFVELLPQKDKRIQELEHTNNRSGDILARTQKRLQELEEGLATICDIVAKVSVDTHHAEPGEAWYEKKNREERRLTR